MRIKSVDLLVGAAATVVGIVAIAWTTAPAGPKPTDNVLLALSQVSATETPATVVRLLRGASPEARTATAQRVPEAVVALQRPALLPYVVSLAAHAQPDVAAALVAAAGSVCPEQLLPCVKAAVLAAPGQTEAIVAAVCRAVPAAFAETAVLAARHAPDKSAQILQAVSTTIPALAPLIARAQEQFTARTEMTVVMTHVAESLKIEGRNELGKRERQNVQRLLQTASEPGVQTGNDGLPPDTLQTVRNASRAAQAEIAAAEKAVASSPTAQVSAPDAAQNSSPTLSSLYQTRFGPTVGPPFTAPRPGRTVIGIDDTVVVQPGTGRDYSRP